MQNDLLKKRKFPWNKEVDRFREETPDKIWADEPEEDSDEEANLQDDDDEDFDADDFGDDDFSFSSEGESEDDSDGEKRPSGVKQKADMYKREFWLKKQYQPAWMQKKESE